MLAASATLLGQKQAELAYGEISAKAAGAPAGVMKVSIPDYPALQVDYGSVRIGTSAIGGDNYPVGLFAPVILNRAPGPIFHALNAACTHAGCIVPTLDPASKIMQCRCHGSRFTLTGQVVNGPAAFPLQSYEISLRGNELVIRIPDLAFDVTVRKPATSGKIELEFLSFVNLEYQVMFRPSLQAAASPVPFATTSNGPENQTTFAGIDDYIKVYVTPAGTSGFYEVAMKTRAV